MKENKKSKNKKILIQNNDRAERIQKVVYLFALAICFLPLIVGAALTLNLFIYGNHSYNQPQNNSIVTPTPSVSPTALPEPTKTAGEQLLETEYNDIETSLKTYINEPNKLTKIDLKEMGLNIFLPSDNKVTFQQTEKVVSDYYEGGGSYEQSPDCYELDSKTLIPTKVEVYCKYYSISYTISSKSKLTEVSENFEIYINSYPNELVGIVSNGSNVTTKNLNILDVNTDYKIISTANSGNYQFLTAHGLNGNSFTIKRSGYGGYQPDPEEITKLREELLFQVIQSLKAK